MPAMIKDDTNAILKKTSELVCRKATANLAKRGFEAVYCETAAEAADFIINATANARTVGFGGSQSVVDLEIFDKLAANGARLLIHSDPDLSADEKKATMKAQQTCDVFIAGINGLSTEGDIVNIDGVGNRVAASIYGPGKIILVAGRNKIVDGGVAEALARAKNCAAPPNSMRLSKNTPCAKTGICSDCDSPDRICKVTVIMERKPTRSDIAVLVVNENMGF